MHLPDKNPRPRTQPTYAAAFQCIGAACEDHCCGDWDIPLDSTTYTSYKKFPAEKLGSLVSQFVFLGLPDQPDTHRADIFRAPSGLCPFFGTDKLCNIQKEYGPGLLSATCSIYPRSLSQVEGKLEGSLSLSCPEAARNVLLNPNFAEVAGNLFSGAFRTDNCFHLAGSNGSVRKPPASYLALRDLLIEMVRDRSRPLWLRLLRIGSICQSLEAITEANDAEALAEILHDHHHGIRDSLDLHLHDLPSRPQVKLEIVLALSNNLLQHGSTTGFQNTFWTFVEGIGSPERGKPGDDIDRFLQAEEDYYRPFLENYPFILENYLINYMYQHLFPYGREGSSTFTPQSTFEEFLEMTTHFAWINALLAGIAGHHRAGFAQEHVIQAIQSFTRATEHYPEVLKMTQNYMGQRHLDTLEGMALLLKT